MFSDILNCKQSFVDNVLHDLQRFELYFQGFPIVSKIKKKKFP